MGGTPAPSPLPFLVVVRGETQDVGFRYQTGGSAFKPLGCRASARKPFPASSFRTAGKYGADLEQSSFYSAATVF